VLAVGRAAVTNYGSQQRTGRGMFVSIENV